MSERVVAISAGSFDYSTIGRSGDSEGTVSVPVRVWPGPRSTPTPGGRIRVILTTGWRSDRVYDVQRRWENGDWVSIARDTSRIKVIFIPRRTGTFWFRARVELVEGGTSMWSPPRVKGVAPPP